MSKFLKLFNTHTEYEAYLRGEMILPNVSYCKDIKNVHYNPITFYIYHSSDCNVKKYTIPKGLPFDLTSVVNNG